MVITEVHVKLVKKSTELKAYLSITLDGEIAIHSIKMIERRDGKLFVVFPEQPSWMMCRSCEHRTSAANYCSFCGDQLPLDSAYRIRWVGVVNPISSQARAAINDVCLDAYHREIERAANLEAIERNGRTDHMRE